MQIDHSKPILVTGANGYVASWLVKLLLADGFTVHATVRNPDDPLKTRHLKKAAEKVSGQLFLFKADLLIDSDFDQSMQGCELVFHTASPFIARGRINGQKDLVDPAEKGTRNVLNSVNHVSSVKRVVLTSSVVATYGDARDIALVEEERFSEKHWNTTSSVDHQPYPYSKTVAEKLAWDMLGNQNRWDLVVVNPGLVFGPALCQESKTESISLLKDVCNGLMFPGAANIVCPVVDVRDVAKGHMQAGLKPQASGRHILVSQSMTLYEIGQVLRHHFGRKYLFPLFTAPDMLVWLVAPLFGMTRAFVKYNFGYPLKFDSSYAETDLDLQFRPTSETLIDHFLQLVDDGVFKKRF